VSVATERNFLIYQEEPGSTASNAAPT